MIGDNGFENLVWFMGLVEDIEDPHAGRVRVRCFGFHPTVGEGAVNRGDLPWAFIVRDPKFTSMPDEGDLVVGFFMDGRDAQHPVVFGTINTAKFSLPSIGGSPLSSGPSDQGNYGAPVSVGNAVNMSLEPHQRAFLDAIASKESVGGAYNVRYDGTGDGTTFDLSSGQHPNVPVPLPGGDYSTAAGRYQFTKSTWDGISGNAPFTPENQDYYAWKLAKERYPGDLDNDLKANGGVTSSMLTSLSGTWAAFKILDDHADIIATYDKSLESSKLSTYESSNENTFLAPSQDAFNNFGNPGMPYQFNGEGIDKSPLVTQAAFRKVTAFRDFTINEPLRPVAANVRTAVWQARYGGTSIELAGNTDDNEFVSITHASGSHITLDAKGNITIKSFGSTYNGTEGNMEEIVAGSKLGIYDTGFGILVKGGKCVIETAGDMEFQAGGNIDITAGGKLAINIGNSIDIAGSRIAATARVDAIDLIATGKMALQSKAVGLSIDSTEAVFVQSGKGISFKSAEDFIVQSETNFSLKAADNIGIQAVGGTLGLKSQGSATIASSVNVGLGADGVILVKGSEIHLNSPGLNPAAVSDADDAGEVLATIAADVPEAIPLGVSSDIQYEPSIEQLNVTTPDNPGEMV